MVVVPVDKQAPDLTAKLDRERYGILSWSLEGLKTLIADGGFEQPAAGRDRLASDFT